MKDRYCAGIFRVKQYDEAYRRWNGLSNARFQFIFVSVHLPNKGINDGDRKK
jgi:hypothetical protein